MVADRLREVMLRAERVGELVGPEVRSGSAEHPVCGDRVVLSVRREGDRIAEVRWRASGCPASMAVAALAAPVLVDVPAADAGPTLRAAILEHGGLQAHERHAEAMVMRALAAAGI